MVGAFTLSLVLRAGFEAGNRFFLQLARDWSPGLYLDGLNGIIMPAEKLKVKRVKREWCGLFIPCAPLKESRCAGGAFAAKRDICMHSARPHRSPQPTVAV